MEEETAELKVIINCTSSLVTALKNDTEIRHWLLARGFLSQNTYDRAIATPSPLTESEKCSGIVSELRDKVKLNKERYHIFMNEIRKHSRYEDIVRILEQEYKRQSAPAATLTASPKADSGMFSLII